MKVIIFSLFVWVPIFVHCQAEDPLLPEKDDPITGLDAARVTIPYGELKQLLRLAHLNEDEVPAPPVEAVLHSAEYLLDLSGSTPSLVADFQIRTFTDAWHSLPLFSGSPRLKSSDDSIDIVWRDDAYHLLANGKGAFQAKLNLTVGAIDQWSAGRGFLFCPFPANRIVFKVRGVPAGQTVRLGDLNPVKSDAGELEYHLSGEEGEFNTSLEQETGSEPVVPSDWSLHSQMMIHYTEGRLQHFAQIQARADSGSGMTMDLELPQKASRITMEGDDIEQWKLASRSDRTRLLKVTWKTRDVLDRSIILSWELPQSALSDKWTVTPPAVAETEGVAGQVSSRSLVAMLAVDGLELSHPDLVPSEDARRLPEWLREKVGGNDCVITEMVGDTPIDLAASWLPRLKTAQATVSLAKFTTRLVTDGSMLVDAEYTIQHASPINWVLELPSSDQILMCEVNRESANPIQREVNKIEFRLSTPSTQTGTKIHLCYALKDAALDPVSGQVTLALPRTDLFIHRLDWALAIPGQYEPTAVQGNVQLSNSRETSKDGDTGSLIHLQKELCRGEQPAVEIYYQRKDLNTES